VACLPTTVRMLDMSAKRGADNHGQGEASVFFLLLAPALPVFQHIQHNLVLPVLPLVIRERLRGLFRLCHVAAFFRSSLFTARSDASCFKLSESSRSYSSQGHGVLPSLTRIAASIP